MFSQDSAAINDATRTRVRHFDPNFWQCDNKQPVRFTSHISLYFPAPFSLAWLPCGQIDLETESLNFNNCQGNELLLIIRQTVPNQQLKSQRKPLPATTIQTLLILGYYRQGAYTFRNMYVCMYGWMEILSNLNIQV